MSDKKDDQAAQPTESKVSQGDGGSSSSLPNLSMNDMKQSMKETINTIKSNRPALKEAIKVGFVDNVNSLLSSLEQTYVNNVCGPLTSSLKTVQSSSERVLHKGLEIYDKREEYGPQIVGGTSLVVGSFLTLRRGKYFGLLGGILAGGIAYSACYEMNLYKLPDYIFGGNDDSINSKGKKD